MKYFIRSSVLALLASCEAASLPKRNCSPSGISAERAAEVRAKFLESKSIPDTVPDIQPKVELTMKYGNINVNLGNEFEVVSTLSEPTFEFSAEEGYNPATTKYTYIQVDPDAPGPQLPLLRHFLHQVVYDLQPSCIADQTPKTQARYMPLTPLSVAAHRYISLIYRQPPNYTPTPLNPLEDVLRAPFDVQKYVDENHLELVGGNFFVEGLGTTICALLPGCIETGEGYDGPMDGTAEPPNGIGDILSGLADYKDVSKQAVTQKRLFRQRTSSMQQNLELGHVIDVFKTSFVLIGGLIHHPVAAYFSAGKKNMIGGGHTPHNLRVNKEIALLDHTIDNIEALLTESADLDWKSVAKESYHWDETRIIDAIKR